MAGKANRRLALAPPLRRLARYWITTSVMRLSVTRRLRQFSFCVGTSNLRDLVTCMDEHRDAEWVPVDASQLK